MPNLPYGIYERLATERLLQLIESGEGIPDWSEIDEAEAPLILSRYLAEAVQRMLRALPAKNRQDAQVELLNRFINAARDWQPDSVEKGDEVLPKLLTALVPEAAKAPQRPGIALSESDLLVNARGERRIGHEIAAEIRSADRVDLICSFIKRGGVRLLLPAISEHLRAGKPMRVITTTYLASTDQAALDQLQQLGAQIKVSYDTRRTRLHAKAWLMHRETGYTTAYIGSSNLSATAQTDGLEWNVRVSAVDAPRIISKFEAAFGNYWADSEFVSYDGTEESRETFRRAIQRESADDSVPILYFDVKPWPFQQEILDQLDADRRVRGRTRNLVVAATGTGKTVVAALDYRRLREAGDVNSLLFVAHRKEILEQSRLTFRHVLRDGSFGEMQVGGSQPDAGTHVFASIQSLSEKRLEEMDPKSFDMVIVDEFHHAAAKTYDRFLSRVDPKYLLGLTATPERADGRSILHWFDDHTTAEVRLWDAIERGLLVPFQYFASHDNTDLRNVRWDASKGYSIADLEQIYTADHFRVNAVLSALEKHLVDRENMRALGFCVSIRHADFMAKAFTDAGIPSVALHSESHPAIRSSAISKLQRREINVIFTVDLFNEGVDIPFLDTVFFLRPTKSSTVFIQQLGRGLRHHEEKESLTVLDFVGKARREFRYDTLFGSLLRMRRGKLRSEVEDGFPHLPSGCSIQLDRKSQEIILENLRESLGSDKRSLVSELRRGGADISLGQFLHDTQLDLEDIYKGGRFFSDLRRAAGGEVLEAGPEEDALGRALGRILHLDDPGLISRSIALLKGEEWGGSERELGLLLVPLFGPEVYSNLEDGVVRLREHPAICGELEEILVILLDRVDHVPASFEAYPDVPLKVHCQYSRDQIMAGFGVEKAGKLYRPREGVVFDEESRANLMFVTINKSEKDYSPSTMYEDYAMSSTEFHWQSQATTRPETTKGRRHWEHQERGITPLLFVREARRDEYGNTMPYFFLGPVTYEQHTGERPMNVTWKVKEPIPQGWMRKLRVA